MDVFDLILMSYDELVRWNSRRTSGCRAFCSGQPFPVPEAVSNWLGRISTLTKIVSFYFSLVYNLSYRRLPVVLQFKECGIR